MRTRHAGVAAVVALAIGLGVWFVLGSSGGKSSRQDETGVYHGPAALTALAVRTDRDTYVALVGSMGARPPVVVEMPSRLVLLMPGSGTGLVSDAARVSGRLFAASLSNLLGAWVDHYAVGDAAGLARTVEAAGGLTLDLDAPVKLAGQTVGPGPTVLLGSEVAAYLSSAPPVERGMRWREVLEAFFHAPVAPVGFADLDDSAAVGRAFTAARDASVTALPARRSAGGLFRADDDGVRRLMATRFGLRTEPPVGVVALNGSGVPGVGEEVARLLVPGGFRIVSSGNADRFDHEETVIYAQDRGTLSEAERARKLLGVGQVVLGGGSSGLADITIVVGRDLPAS